MEKKKIGGKMLSFTKWEEMSRVESRDRHAWWRSKNFSRISNMRDSTTVKATLRIANFFRLLAHSILFSTKLFCWKMNPNSENISELLKWGLRFKNCLMFYQYIQRIRKAKSWIGYKSWRELSNTSIAWNWS